MRSTKKALLALFVFGLAGCATGPATCQSICDQQAAAGCASAGCATTCENDRANATSIGCGAQHTALINCIERNACSASTACATEVANLSACSTDYCTANPTDPACVGP